MESLSTTSSVSSYTSEDSLNLDSLSELSSTSTHKSIPVTLLPPVNSRSIYTRAVGDMKDIYVRLEEVKNWVTAIKSIDVERVNTDPSFRQEVLKALDSLSEVVAVLTTALDNQALQIGGGLPEPSTRKPLSSDTLTGAPLKERHFLGARGAVIALSQAVSGCKASLEEPDLDEDVWQQNVEDLVGQDVSLAYQVGVLQSALSELADSVDTPLTLDAIKEADKKLGEGQRRTSSFVRRCRGWMQRLELWGLDAFWGTADALAKVESSLIWGGGFILDSVLNVVFGPFVRASQKDNFSRGLPFRINPADIMVLDDSDMDRLPGTVIYNGFSTPSPLKVFDPLHQTHQSSTSIRPRQKQGSDSDFDRSELVTSFVQSAHSLTLGSSINPALHSEGTVHRDQPLPGFDEIREAELCSLVGDESQLNRYIADHFRSAEVLHEFIIRRLPSLKGFFTDQHLHRLETSLHAYKARLMEQEVNAGRLEAVERRYKGGIGFDGSSLEARDIQAFIGKVQSAMTRHGQSVKRRHAELESRAKASEGRDFQTERELLKLKRDMAWLAEESQSDSISEKLSFYCNKPLGMDAVQYQANAIATKLNGLQGQVQGAESLPELEEELAYYSSILADLKNRMITLIDDETTDYGQDELERLAPALDAKAGLQRSIREAYRNWADDDKEQVRQNLLAGLWKARSYCLSHAGMDKKQEDIRQAIVLLDSGDVTRSSWLRLNEILTRSGSMLCEDEHIFRHFGTVAYMAEECGWELEQNCLHHYQCSQAISQVEMVNQLTELCQVWSDHKGEEYAAACEEMPELKQFQDAPPSGQWALRKALGSYARKYLDYYKHRQIPKDKSAKDHFLGELLQSCSVGEKNASTLAACPEGYQMVMLRKALTSAAAMTDKDQVKYPLLNHLANVIPDDCKLSNLTFETLNVWACSMLHKSELSDEESVQLMMLYHMILSDINSRTAGGPFNSEGLLHTL